MPPLVIAIAAGVGLYAAARAVRGQMRRIGAAIDKAAAAPKNMGTLERDPDSGVYRAPPSRKP